MAEVDAGAPAPVVPVAPAAEPAPTPEPTAGTEVVAPEGAEPEATPPEKMLPQSEVNRLVAKEKAQAAKRAEKLAMERFRAESAERELARLRAETTPKPTTPQGEPQPDQFENPKDYVKALVRYERAQAEQEEKSRKATEQQQRSSSEAKAYLQERFTAAEEDYPDLQGRLASDEIALSDAMLGFVLDTDHGFKVGDYLASNPAESRKIAQLPPAKQILELNQIASTLAAPPVTTKTQAPIVPNGTKATVASGYRPDMSDAAFAKWRAEQRKAKQS